MTSETLLDFTYDNGHEVFFGILPETKSLSLENDGSCYIALDMSLLSHQSLVCLAHELGHCEYGGFYSIDCSFETRGRCEYRANKWAIKKLVPKDELEDAVTRGIIECWELAEHFGVTEDFMKLAIEYYQRVFLNKYIV